MFNEGFRVEISPSTLVYFNGLKKRLLVPFEKLVRDVKEIDHAKIIIYSLSKQEY